ncbi:MAG: LysM peptidoglycan-binding domain-containing protein [Bacteroidota bacterium]
MILAQNHPLPLNGNRLSFVVILLLLLLFSPAQAQEEKPIKRSHVIEQIDGRKYYIHEIKPGHTVYSVAKAYGVKPDLIYQHNPDAKGTIEPGLMLKIPVSAVEQKLQRDEQDADPEESDASMTQEPVNNGEKKIITHTVRENETLYSLARKYKTSVEELKELNANLVDILEKGQKIKIRTSVQPPAQSYPQTADNGEDSLKNYTVKKGETLYRIAVNHNLSVERIIRLNPELADGLKAGQIIKLPVAKEEKEIDEIPVDEQKQPGQENFLTHVVKEGETLYSLSMQYSIAIDDLMAVNPSLSDGLKAGQKIRIPVDQKQQEIPALFIPEKQIMDSLPFVPKEDTLIRTCDSSTIYRSYTIALMMPFYFDNRYVIKPDDYKENGWPETHFKSFEYIQFYEGFLMAVDSLKKAGFHAHIKIFDTKNDPEEVKRILQKTDLDQFDLVFGPFHSDALKLVVDQAAKSNVKVVAPTYDLDVVKGNKHLIKLFTPMHYQLDRVVNHIYKEHRLKNLIFVYGSAQEKSMIEENILPRLAKKMGLKDSIYPWTVIDYRAQGYSGLKSSLSSEKANFLICTLKGEVTVNRLITRLNGLRKDYDLSLLASDQWESYQSLESEYLNNLGYMSFNNYLINYDDIRVKAFVKKFSTKYHTWPHPKAFVGFDVGYFFLSALYNYGINFPQCMHYQKVFTMHNDFQFRQWKDNAWQNSSVNIYQYRDFKRVNLIREFMTPDSGELNPRAITRDKAVD